jgi:hypothetical protein
MAISIFFIFDRTVDKKCNNKVRIYLTRLNETWFNEGLNEFDKEKNC